MKNTASILFKTVLLIVVIAGVGFWADYAFTHSPAFRGLFSSTGAAEAVIGRVDPASGQTLAMREELAGRISMFVFVGISLMQFVALFIAHGVIRRIARSGESPKLQFRQLENANIFLDVPLYIGLFGTVSSFLIITFSPTSSRLIAYSSTMIGIIFSLVLRLAFDYPLRRRLINQLDGDAK